MERFGVPNPGGAEVCSDFNSRANSKVEIESKLHDSYSPSDQKVDGIVEMEESSYSDRLAMLIAVEGYWRNKLRRGWRALRYVSFLRTTIDRAFLRSSMLRRGYKCFRSFTLNRKAQRFLTLLTYQKTLKIWLDSVFCLLNLLHTSYTQPFSI